MLAKIRGNTEIPRHRAADTTPMDRDRSGTVRVDAIEPQRYMRSLEGGRRSKLPKFWGTPALQVSFCVTGRRERPQPTNEPST